MFLHGEGMECFIYSWRIGGWPDDEGVAMQRGMKRALRQWRGMPDGVPDGDEVCRLIEATGSEKVDLRVARRFNMKKSSGTLRRKRNPPRV